MQQPLVTELIDRRAFDVVHLDGFALCGSLGYLSRHRVPTLLSVIDPTSRVFREAAFNRSGLRSLYYRTMAPRVRMLERTLCPLASAVHVVSQPEAAYLESVSPDAKISVVPISVSAPVLAPAPVIAAMRYDLMLPCNLSRGVRQDGAADFLDKVMPELCGRFPDLKILLVGREPTRSLRDRIERSPAVRYKAWSEDLWLDMRESKVVVFPESSGTGIKNRVVSAMGLSRPVVGTAKALEGIHYTEGEDCFCYRDPAECITILHALLSDEACRRRTGARARDLVRREHSMEANGPRWERLYAECVMTQGRRSQNVR